jgi:hypothetical protein
MMTIGQKLVGDEAERCVDECENEGDDGLNKNQLVASDNKIH